MSLSIWNDNDIRTMKRVLGTGSRVLAELGHKNSLRARQRAIAFYIGAHTEHGFIGGEHLRDWCKELGAYNRANFAQNMTKEAKRGLVTGNIRTTGGWTLTEKGREYAAKLTADIDSMAARLEQSMKTLTIKCEAKAVRCAMCGDDAEHHEHILKCECCGMTIHAECDEEMRPESNWRGSHLTRGHCPNGCGRMTAYNVPHGPAQRVEENAA